MKWLQNLFFSSCETMDSATPPNFLMRNGTVCCDSDPPCKKRCGNPFYLKIWKRILPYERGNPILWNVNNSLRFWCRARGNFWMIVFRVGDRNYLRKISRFMEVNFCLRGFVT